MKNIKIEKKTDVLKRVSISKSTLHRKINSGEFPPPISLGANSVGFLSHEIDAYIIDLSMNKDAKESVTKIMQYREKLSGEHCILST
ncbi:AlpA family phage regulatory protein [Vibrio sp. T187]|uniref:helix-turn-helix transcriptional regulator n=1 Tax=Vibrio TaxID=662 RepID=UPI0010C9E81C|nr:MULTISPECIES: AlpA family phage regulatory protein [Vibrio]MBW3697971.1 AlpA family phage regulatory protein [Vibrio sp. T187]